MPMNHTRLIRVAIGGVLAAAALAWALTGPEILHRIRQTYERVNTFQAAFDQTFEWKLAATTQRMSGRFYMKKPNRFRIQTDVQTVVTNGKTVWSYSPATQQVIINDYDPATMPLRPDNFLFAFPDEEQVTYVGDERLEEADCHVMDVVPRDSTLGIEKMRVWVDSRTWTAKKVQYTSISQDITTYVLKEIQTNRSLPDSLFTFSIPQGTDVVDFRAQ